MDPTLSPKVADTNTPSTSGSTIKSPILTPVDINISVDLKSFKDDRGKGDPAEVQAARQLLKTIQDMAICCESNTKLRAHYSMLATNKINCIFNEFSHKMQSLLDETKKRVIETVNRDIEEEKIFLQKLHRLNSDLSSVLDDLGQSKLLSVNENLFRFQNTVFEIKEAMNDIQESFRSLQISLSSKRFTDYSVNTDIATSVEINFKHLIFNNIDDIIQPQPRRIQVLPSSMGNIIYLKNRNELAITEMSGQTTIYELDRFNITRSFTYPDSVVDSIYISETNTLVSSVMSGFLYCWNLKNGSVCKPIKIGQTHVSYLENLENDKVACSGGNNELIIVDLGKEITECVLKFDDNVSALAKIKGTNMLALGSFNGAILLYDLAKQIVIEKVKSHGDEKDWIHLLTYCEQKKLLMSACLDGSVKFWKIGSNGKIELKASSIKVKSLIGSLFPLEKIDVAVTANWDNHLRFFSMKTGEIIKQFEVEEAESKHAVYLEDKDCIVVAYVIKGILSFYSINQLLN